MRITDYLGRPARYAVVYAVSFDHGPRIEAVSSLEWLARYLASMAEGHYAHAVQVMRVTARGMVPL